MSLLQSGAKPCDILNARADCELAPITSPCMLNGGLVRIAKDGISPSKPQFIRRQVIPPRRT